MALTKAQVVKLNNLTKKMDVIKHDMHALVVRIALQVAGLDHKAYGSERPVEISQITDCQVSGDNIQVIWKTRQESYKSFYFKSSLLYDSNALTEYQSRLTKIICNQEKTEAIAKFMATWPRVRF